MGETTADALAALVVTLREYNDVRESQRPPDPAEEVPVVVELPREPAPSRH